MQQFVNSGKSEIIKIIGIFLTIITMIVGITLFVADRPTRAEVKSEIDSTVNTRMERLEKTVDMNAEKIDKIYNILIEKNK